MILYVKTFLNILKLFLPSLEMKNVLKMAEMANLPVSVDQCSQLDLSGRPPRSIKLASFATASQMASAVRSTACIDWLTKLDINCA